MRRLLISAVMVAAVVLAMPAQAQANTCDPWHGIYFLDQLQGQQHDTETLESVLNEFRGVCYEEAWSAHYLEQTHCAAWFEYLCHGDNDWSVSYRWNFWWSYFSEWSHRW